MPPSSFDGLPLALAELYSFGPLCSSGGLSQLDWKICKGPLRNSRYLKTSVCYSSQRHYCQVRNLWARLTFFICSSLPAFLSIVGYRSDLGSVLICGEFILENDKSDFWQENVHHLKIWSLPELPRQFLTDNSDQLFASQCQRFRGSYWSDTALSNMGVRNLSDVSRSQF